MKLFGFHLNISRSEAKSGAVAKQFTPAQWLRGEDLDSGPTLSNAYEQVVWVYRAINALAEQVANIPFVFSSGQRGRENLIPSGPLHDFYARPHPLLNRFQYWELRIIWLMLRGECFRIPIYSTPNPELNRNLNPHPLSSRSSGRESALIPPAEPGLLTSAPGGRRLEKVLMLDPAHFQHVVEDGQLLGWRYTGNGPNAPLASQVFLPEEVWFEKLPNPFDFWRGLPPLRVASVAARTDYAAATFMRGTIENNGDTGVLVRTEKWLSDEQQDQVLAALRKRKRRAGTSDRPAFLCGVAEIVKPELSSSDLQFLENRRFTRSEICAAFGVPEEILTTTEHAKYDVMEGARLNFIENRVAPLCSRLEAEEEITVKSIDPQAAGWFDLDTLPILQQARRNRLTAARSAFEMGVPFNQLNEVLDLGFRRLSWGDRGYVANTFHEAGEERVPEKPAATAGATTAGQTSALERAERLCSGLAEAAKASKSDSLPSALRRFQFEQRKRVLERLNRTPAGLEADQWPAFLEQVLDVAGEEQALVACMSKVSAGGSTHWTEQNRDLLAALRRTLAEGLSAGEDANALSTRARNVFNQS